MAGSQFILKYSSLYVQRMAHPPNPATNASLAETNSPEQQREFDESRQYIRITASVERPINSHGALRLSAVDSQRTFQVVDYATDELRQAMADVVRGTTVDIRLVGLGARGSAWRVVAVDSTDQTTDQPRIAAGGSQ